MENLLASIRQAIDNDLGDARKAMSSGSSTVKGTMNEMRLRPSQSDPRARAAEITREINELKSKIGSHRAPDPVKPKTPFAQIMAGGLDTPTPRPHSTAIVPAQAPQPEEIQPYQGSPAEQYEAYAEEGEWQEEQAYLPAPDHESGYDAFSEPPIMSERAASAANSSFNELADALMARAMGERPIEDIAHEMLRTMLRSWLDQHLPNMVERLVREEIERVARRGR
jgi:uncharacterized protein